MDELRPAPFEVEKLFPGCVHDYNSQDQVGRSNLGHSIASMNPHLIYYARYRTPQTPMNKPAALKQSYANMQYKGEKSHVVRVLSSAFTMISPHQKYLSHLDPINHRLDFL